MCRVEEKKEIGLTDEVMIIADGVYKGMISLVTEVIETKGGIILYRLIREDLIEQMEERREELHHALCEARQDKDTKLIEMIIGEGDLVDEEIYRLKQKDSSVLFVETDLEKLDFDDEEEEDMITELKGIKIGDIVKITAKDSVLYGEEIEVVGFDRLDTEVLILNREQTKEKLINKMYYYSHHSEKKAEVFKIFNTIEKFGIVYTTPDRVQKVEESSHLDKPLKIAKGDVIEVVSERNPFFGYWFSVSKVEDERVIPFEEEVVDVLEMLIVSAEDDDMLDYLHDIITAIEEGDEVLFEPEEVEKVSSVVFSPSDKLKEAIKSAQESTNDEPTRKFSAEMKEAKKKFEETVEQKTLGLIEVGDIVSHVDIKGLHKVTEKYGMSVVLMGQDNNGGFNGFESVVADSKINGLRLEFRENQVREPYDDGIGRTVRFVTKNFPEIECVIELENGEIYKGKSRCNLEEDEFDAEIGKKIAFFRANKKMAEDILRRCNVELNKITQ